MKQLGGGDDIWFAVDTDTTPMQMALVGIYEPATNGGAPIDLQVLSDLLKDRLDGLPFRQKLVRVPGNLDFPYWIEDEHFDLDRHLHEVRVRAPGDWPALVAAVTEIMAQPLDWSRPLWDMYLLTGLGPAAGVSEGGFALVQKLHHGQFDGTNVMRITKRLMSAEPSARPAPPDRWSPEPIPSGLELLMRAPWNGACRARKGARLLRANGPALADALKRRRRSDGSNAEKRSVPPTRFSQPIGTRERVVDVFAFPLEEAAAIGRSVDGATVNDVVLAIATGALRKYLTHHRELPEDPLVVSLPVSAHDKGENELTGNRLSAMIVPLPTHVADPLEQLRQVRAATMRSKASTKKIGASNVADAIDIVPTHLLGPVVERIVGWGLSKYVPNPASGISITNVPGPSEPLYLRGARLVRGFAGTFLLDGMGLILAASSYCDELVLQFTSTPNMMPDPAFFVACLREAYEELAAAVP